METGRPWLGDYPPGVPAEITSGIYRSVNQLFETSCRKYKNLPAFTNMGQMMTYGELDKLSGQFATFLRSLPGMAQGERVAIMMPNLLQYPIALFGVLRAAGFEKRHLVKVTIFVTERGSVGVFRDVRDRMLDGHLCACTYLEIAGLAAPQLLVEIEGEAVKD